MTYIPPTVSGTGPGGLTPLLADARIAALSGYLRGVALNGAEFGQGGVFSNATPGAAGTDYDYPNAADFLVIAARGERLVRLPVRWERLQDVAGGNDQPLRASELALLDAAIRAANAAGIVLALDLQNFARYNYATSAGAAPTVLVLRTATGLDATNAALGMEYHTNFWKRLAAWVMADPVRDATVIAYNHNEPHDLTPVLGTFTGNGTRYAWDGGTVQGWQKDYGDPTATLSASATADAGAGSLRVQLTAVSPTNYANLRISDAGQRLGGTLAGDRLQARVRGVSGNGWVAQMYWQDNGTYAEHLGPEVPLVNGQWVTIQNAAGDGITASNVYAYGVKLYTNTNSGSTTAEFLVDTYQQGSVSGGQNAAQVWEAIAQDWVSGVRAAGDQERWLLVPGVAYTNAATFATNHPAAFISDPARRTRYDAHHYFDRDNSGTYINTYASEVTDAASKGFTAGANADALQTRILTELRSFTDWLARNGALGYIGEVGWPNHESSAAWNALGELWFRAADSARLWAQGWSAGHVWTASDKLAIYHSATAGYGPLGNDGAQAAILRAHPTVAVAAVAGGAGVLGVVTKTGAYTLTAADRVVLADTSGGAFTLTLPAPGGATGIAFQIKQKAGGNVLTVAATTGTIDGGATLVFPGINSAYTIVSDGSSYYIF